MLTTEVKVNGVLIGHLYVVNKGMVGHEINKRFYYEYTYYRVGEEAIKGNVEHDYSDGAEVLMLKCFKDYGEELQKKESPNE